MATLVAYQAADMVHPYIWYGTVTKATSSRITINDYEGQSGTYYGSFTYKNGDLYSGKVTGYDSYYNYNSEFTIKGGSLNAMTVYNYLENSDAQGLQQYALSGSDTLTGSKYSDYLMGWNGNDKINAGAGDDFIDGCVGKDTLTGGSGADTFVFDLADYSKNAPDTITDFKHSDDDLIDVSAFGDIGIYSTLSLAKQEAWESLIYETSTGKIYYDEDGFSADSGSEAAVIIATISGKPELVAADFI